MNHTLWNREGDRIFFFVRANVDDPNTRINVPMTVKPDGSELTEQRVFIGGHPEWDVRSRMQGAVEGKLILYDTLAQQIVDTIGGSDVFRDPEGDSALSRDGKWIVNRAIYWRATPTPCSYTSRPPRSAVSTISTTPRKAANANAPIAAGRGSGRNQ